MRMNNRDERKADKPRFFTAFTISALLHVLLFSGSFYMQYLAGLKRPELKTIDVSLVTLPGPGSSKEVAMPVEEPAPPEPEPEPPQAKPPVKSDPAEPKPDKKKVVAEKKEPEKKAEKPKRKTPKKQPSDFERTLERLRQEVQKGPPSDLYKRSGPGRFAPGEGEYGAPMSPLERYLVEIVTIIRRNWSFTPQLIRETGEIKTYVALSIEPNGAISDIGLDRRSVSRYFDDTVIKAIEKSSPLPPVPPNVSKKAMRIGLVFTPRGIE